MGICQSNYDGDLTAEELQLFRKRDSAYSMIWGFEADFGKETTKQNIPIKYSFFRSRPLGLEVAPESDDEYAPMIIQGITIRNWETREFNIGDIIIGIGGKSTYNHSYMSNAKLFENLRCSQRHRLKIEATNKTGFETMKQWSVGAEERRKERIRKENEQRKRRGEFAKTFCANTEFAPNISVTLDGKVFNGGTIPLLEQPQAYGSRLGKMGNNTVVVLSRLLIYDGINQYMKVKVISCVSNDNLEGKIGFVDHGYYRSSEMEQNSDSFWEKFWIKKGFSLDQF